MIPTELIPTEHQQQLQDEDEYKFESPLKTLTKHRLLISETAEGVQSTPKILITPKNQSKPTLISPTKEDLFKPAQLKMSESLKQLKTQTTPMYLSGSYQQQNACASSYSLMNKFRDTTTRKNSYSPNRTSQVDLTRDQLNSS